MAKSTYAYTINVPAETRGWGDTKRQLPALRARVEVQIDIEKIANHHGRQAARSKGQRRQLLGGMVVIKVIDSKEA